jgi:hypothetical protein
MSVTHSVQGPTWNKFQSLEKESNDARQSSVHPRGESPHHLAHPEVGLSAAMHYARSFSPSLGATGEGTEAIDSSVPPGVSSPHMSPHRHNGNTSSFRPPPAPSSNTKLYQASTVESRTDLDRELEEKKEVSLDLFQAELNKLMRRSIDAEAAARASAAEIKDMERKHAHERIELVSKHKAELDRMRQAYEEEVVESRLKGRSDAELDWEQHQLELKGRADHAELELARRMRDNARVVGAVRAGYGEDVAYLQDELNAARRRNTTLVNQLSQKSSEMRAHDELVQAQRRKHEQSVNSRLASFAAEADERAREREEEFERRVLREKDVEIEKMRRSYMALVLENQDRAAATNMDSVAKATVQTSLAGIEEMRRVQQNCEDRVRTVMAAADERCAVLEDEVKALRTELEGQSATLASTNLEAAERLVVELKQEVRRGEERERALTETLTRQTNELRRKQDSIELLRRELSDKSAFDSPHPAGSRNELPADLEEALNRSNGSPHVHGTPYRYSSEQGTEVSALSASPGSPFSPRPRLSSTGARVRPPRQPPSAGPISGRAGRTPTQTTSSKNPGRASAWSGDRFVAHQGNVNGNGNRADSRAPRWKPAAQWQ